MLRLHTGEIVTCKPVHEERSYDLVVVDEAHHIYGDPISAEVVNLDVDRSAARVFLSDASQSLGKGIDFPDTGKVHLNEVVRSSKRIITAASSFQLGQHKDETRCRCFHETDGMPLRSYIFEVEGDRFECYASQTLRALKAIQKDFQGLSLHNRVAIIVPDAEFRKELSPALSKALADRNDTTRMFQLIDSQNSSACIEGLHASTEGGEWLVLDEIANFDGLERLIVVAVGLDAVIERERDDTLATRSRLYRGLTRAQMLACVVNEMLVGGWLEFLTRVQLEEGAFDEEEERKRLDAKAELDRIIDSELKEAVEAHAQLCELAKSTIVELIKKQQLPSGQAVRAAVQAQADIWVQYEADAKASLLAEAARLGLKLGETTQQQLERKVAACRLRDKALEQRAALTRVIQDYLPAAATEALTAGPGLRLTQGEVRLLALKVALAVSADKKFGAAVSEAVLAWETEARPIQAKIRAQTKDRLPEPLTDNEVASAAASVVRQASSSAGTDDAMRKVLRDDVYPAKINAALSSVADLKLDAKLLFAAVLQSLEAGTPLSQAVETAVTDWQTEEAELRTLIASVAKDLGLPRQISDSEVAHLTSKVAAATRGGSKRDVALRKLLVPIVQEAVVTPMVAASLGDGLKDRLKDAKALALELAAVSEAGADALRTALEPVVKALASIYAEMRADARRQDVKAVYKVYKNGPQDSDGLKKAIEEQLAGSQRVDARRASRLEPVRTRGARLAHIRGSRARGR